MKSLLFVPADSERKLARCAEAGADAIALDLEDSVLPERKPAARELLAGFMPSWKGDGALWVRVNDLESGELLRDLAAVVPCAPVGIVLPKIQGVEDIATVSHYLDMAETMAGIKAGATGIIAVCTETPSAVLRMARLAESSQPRLRGLIWGGEDLSAALGAGDPRDDSGGWRPMYQHARNQCLLAAHALGVEAIDTVFVDVRDTEGCRRHALEARHDGFTGKVAIHPGQVPAINAAFTPSEEEVAYARRVVESFECGQGAVALDGKMLDIPHLRAAQRILRSV